MATSEMESLPPAIRALVEAELAAGNAIAQFDHGFPAPPVGCAVRLARPLTTLPEGLAPCAFPNWDGSTGYSDERRHFFVLQPAAPEPEPTPEPAAEPEPAPQPEALSPAARFAASLEIGYEQWHDGIGYDIDALREADDADRASAEAVLLARGATDWRDVEALAALGTPKAVAALRAALDSPDPAIPLAVAEYAPELVSESERTAALVRALEYAEFYGGLTQALDAAAEFHPPAVVDALWRGAERRSGEVAFHCAALLLFVHGAASSPFDDADRPFLLRFNTEDPSERAAALRDLRARLS